MTGVSGIAKCKCGSKRFFYAAYSDENWERHWCPFNPETDVHYPDEDYGEPMSSCPVCEPPDQMGGKP